MIPISHFKWDVAKASTGVGRGRGRMYTSIPAPLNISADSKV
jgi:hypothetical protein